MVTRSSDKPFKADVGIGCREFLITAFLRLVAPNVPCGKLRIHSLQIWDAPLLQALRDHCGSATSVTFSQLPCLGV